MDERAARATSESRDRADYQKLTGIPSLHDCAVAIAEKYGKPREWAMDVLRYHKAGIPLEKPHGQTD